MDQKVEIFLGLLSYTVKLFSIKFKTTLYAQLQSIKNSALPQSSLALHICLNCNLKKKKNKGTKASETVYYQIPSGPATFRIQSGLKSWEEAVPMLTNMTTEVTESGETCHQSEAKWWVALDAG